MLTKRQKSGASLHEEVATYPSLQTERQRVVNLNGSVRLIWLIRIDTRLQAYLWLSPKPMAFLCTMLPSNLPHPWPHFILKLLSQEIFVDWLMTFSVAMWSRGRVPTAKFDERSLLCSKELKLLQNLVSSGKKASVWVSGLAWYIKFSQIVKSEWRRLSREYCGQDVKNMKQTNNIKSVRENCQLIYKGKQVKIASALSSGTLKAWKGWNNVLYPREANSYNYDD